MLKGEATWNFTVMFLQLWQHVSEAPVDYEKYHISPKDFPIEIQNKGDGFVQPYADNPLFSEVVSEYDTPCHKIHLYYDTVSDCR